MNLKGPYRQLTTQLSQLYDATEATNIARLVFEHITGQPFFQLSANDFTLTNKQLQQLRDIENRLLTHEPVQYVLNEAWFYELPFYVNEQVLIPRPETEELADWIIKENKSNTAISILDIGTGSGCIPVVLKRKLPTALVSACDISTGALNVAQQNAARHHTEIHFFQTDILDRAQWLQLPKVDIIVSNPPYISLNEKDTLRANVAEFEPGVALFVKDTNPLIFYETMATLAPLILNPGGSIYLEIHEARGTEILHLYNNAGFASFLKKDMQGKNRMLKAVRH